MVSSKISVFGKMQKGGSPSFEFFKLNMYVDSKINKCPVIKSNLTQLQFEEYVSTGLQPFSLTDCLEKCTDSDSFALGTYNDCKVSYCLYLIILMLN